jgi:hypothetical protein
MASAKDWSMRPSLNVAKNPANYDGVPGLSLGVDLSGQQTYSKPNLLGPVTNSNNDVLLGPVEGSKPAFGWGALANDPVDAVEPIQSVIPGPGDQLLGPVTPKSKDFSKTQKRGAIPGILGKVGGSIAGGALLGPVGGILGGLLGGYIGKNGMGSFKSEPLNINNIGSGSNNVYSVYGGAPRGTQAIANNGAAITSLGNGATALTNRYGVTTIQNADGSNAADWSGRSYTKTK